MTLIALRGTGRQGGRDCFRWVYVCVMAAGQDGLDSVSNQVTVRTEFTAGETMYANLIHVCSGSLNGYSVITLIFLISHYMVFVSFTVRKEKFSTSIKPLGQTGDLFICCSK